jgi:acetyl-CoA synthetase
MIKNIAYSCLTEKCLQGFGKEKAIQWLHPDLSHQSILYETLEGESNQIAGALKSLKVGKGDVVAIFLPRNPLLISAFFATLKLQAMSCILFSTLGEEALYDRLENSRAKVLITRRSLLRKIKAIQGKLPDLKKVLVIDQDEDESQSIQSLNRFLEVASSVFEYEHFIEAETPAFIQYTSGSTGKPKGALHVHDAINDMELTFKEVLRVIEDELFWCTADPAWITGLVYGIIAPLNAQARQVQFSGGYSADAWLKILETQKVNVWYTAPTALRMLMQEPVAVFAQHNFSPLDRIYSVGEPLNPEIYNWGKRVFQTEIYDTWFQSETGSIMIANTPQSKVKPGSMGVPRKGVDVVICNERMAPLPAGKPGQLCLHKGWHSMFRTFFKNPEKYAEKFNGELYITGDLAKKDEEGYIWYISRADDVINTAGHLVGPFEVESALLEIEEVTDVAIIGADDPLLYQKLVAFLNLSEGVQWSRELELKCRIHVSNKVSPVAIPSEFQIIERIPKNQSGKILRRVLKAIYESRDPGDLSTMED